MRYRFFLPALAFLCVTPLSVHAATLSLAPSVAHVAAGDTVVVSVLVSSDVPVNAVSGTLSFDSSLLSASLSKAGSFISLWAQEPTISNGVISFEGVALSPGYTGSGGKVLSITLRAKSAGTVDVAWKDASVLANDGEGTELLSRNSGSSIFIQSARPAAVKTVAAPKPMALPTLTLSLVSRPDPTDPTPTIVVGGLVGAERDKVRLLIDDAASLVALPESGEYRLAPLRGGLHAIRVAITRGEGEVVATSTVSVVPIERPHLNAVASEVAAGKPMSVSGTSRYPGATIEVAVVGLEEMLLKGIVAEDGSFSIASANDLPAGEYQMRATVVDSRGARSDQSDPQGLRIAGISLGTRVLSWISIAGAVLGVIAMLGIGAVALFVLASWLVSWRRRLRLQAGTAETKVHTSFKLLRKDIDRFISEIESIRATRALTDIEERFVKHMRNDLTISEHLLDTYRHSMANGSAVDTDLFPEDVEKLQK